MKVTYTGTPEQVLAHIKTPSEEKLIRAAIKWAEEWTQALDLTWERANQVSALARRVKREREARAK